MELFGGATPFKEHAVRLSLPVELSQRWGVVVFLSA